MLHDNKPPASEVAECNVFSSVCYSARKGGGSSHVTITHDALELTIKGPPVLPPRTWTCSTWTSLYRDLEIPHLQTCSNLLPYLPPTHLPPPSYLPPPPNWSKAGGTHPTEMHSFSLWITYGWKAGSWHSTGILSCLGDVKRRPCLISPYHYRLDWLMWFAAFQVRFYRIRTVLFCFV